MSDVEARALAFTVIKACSDLSWQAGAVAERMISGVLENHPVTLCPEKIGSQVGITPGRAAELIDEVKLLARAFCRTELGFESPWET
jgi:hypothetical protein